MSVLNYEKEIYKENIDYDDAFLQSDIYRVPSLYENEKVRNHFINLRSNVVDLNPALVIKCITGTEQDFIMLMNRAKEFLQYNFHGESSIQGVLMELFRECVFGYYVLTPLIITPDVSDIKVHAWNHITCKSNGKRYVTNISFESEEDYNRWFERICRMQGLTLSDDNSLQHCTDRKGVAEFYLRIDFQSKHLISTEINNIHIRKIPKEKYSWDYLVNAGIFR